MKSSQLNLVLAKLREYLSDNADFVIVGRAYSYYPTLVTQNNDTFLYECNGSEIEPYDVFIDLSDYYNIKTSCSCKYHGVGICKHLVAAFKNLMQQIEDETIDLTNKVVKNEFLSKITEIPHKDGIIDTEKLNKMEFARQNNYYTPLNFTAVNKNRVDAVYEDFREDFFLSFNIKRKTNDLLLKCSCEGSKMICTHKFTFLKTFFAKFGKDYFADDFIERFKQRTMEASKFKGLLEFDQAFEMVISTEGISVKEKIKNVVDEGNKMFNLFANDRKAFYLPSENEETAAYGVGIALSTVDYKISDVEVFYGKLDKAKKNLSTKFREISDINFSEALSKIEDRNDKDVVIQGIQLSETFDKEKYSGITIERTKKQIHLFSSIVKSKASIKLYCYKAKDSLTKRNTTEITVSDKEVIPVLKITDKKPFYQLDFKLKIEDELFAVNSTKLLITSFGVIANNQFYRFLNPERAFAVVNSIDQAQMNIVHKGIDELKSTVIEPMSRVYEIDFKGIKTSKSKVKPAIEKHVYLSDEEGKFVVLQPLVQYGKTLVSPEGNEKVWTNSKSLSFQKRDKTLEEDFFKNFKALHPKFEHQSNYFYLSVEEALKSMWLMQVIDQLKSENVRVFGLNDLKSIKYNLNKPTFSVGLSSGTDWFDMNVDIAFGNQKVNLKKLQKAIIKQSNFVELNDGSIGVLPKEWIEKYKKYFKLGNVKKDKIEISNFQFNIIDELYEEETNVPHFLTELHEKKKRINNLKSLKPIPHPKGLNATLRAYQEEGLNWLVFLHENQLGGCLADDMGLGKTLQTIAFFQYLKNQKSTTLPHLVIAPTSLIFNWAAEIEKFAPKLSVLSFIGPKRHDFASSFGDFDIILTTYGSLIKDIEIHVKNKYNYIILDESQAIKNPSSQRFKAVRLLKGFNLLALTGTPIENNTFDLYSQFSFLNPGIFGSVKHFKQTFSDEIDKNQDEYTSELLSRMIHPFLLRRTKTQVAKELPTKTEVVIYCEMGQRQRQVYNEFKDYFKQKINDQIEDEGINKSQMYILQGLTKLRQICNSTALADQEKDYGNESAKLDELVRHLTEKVGGHKILVFSQFVGMLHLVKARLEEEGILFEYLDGQSKNREEKVNNFQNNDKIRVFLISLKAGGTGLNLTEADYVYLIDPWWNPAVESQAIDRCYRIGQDKKVMAYRMICKDTIEEKIVQLQDKKKTVATDVIRVDKESKSFDSNDVERFFGML
ncbi:SNF2-related protein [Brumimicrobium aurantiacum]|uniref:ATP-dependent helicase n=1 Tax=Brumimicrobium aurantiacum TaxID=1737063 RepID=A0A3E1F206_9FLAO|nr:SNF2-related protein [Brumimicrobium aurantiacum]RFC55862.1 hypothetical protein DXU93_02685 [Brumimicrobium aurantiacum]